MADNISLNVFGLDKVFSTLNKLSKELQDEISLELHASATNIRTNAIKNTPVNFSTLRSSIQVITEGEGASTAYSIGSMLKYAPYVEFGTGGSVLIPAGYEDFAILFKGKGVRKINLRPKAYLIPAFEIEKVKLIKRVKEILNA